MRKTLLPLMAAIVAVSVTGCVTTTVVRVDATEAITAETQVPEELLLDIGINVLDLGIPDDVKEAERKVIMPGVRKAESRYIPSVLKTTLQKTGQWGAVRVVPGDNKAVHLQIEGEIVMSNGEELTLDLRAYDATGRVWLDGRYTDKASQYSYAAEYADQDPFQDIYNVFANDLLAVRESLTDDEVLEIRRVSELKFAADIAPDAFASHLAQDDDGRYSVRRLPAEGDPMVERVQRVLEREYMFIDTLDEHYASYQREMDPAYDDWRKYSYQETLYLQDVKRSANMLKIFGAAVLVGGVAMDRNSDTNLGGGVADIMVLMGAVAIKSGFDRAGEARIHADSLRELGDSFEAEVAPLVVDIEGQTITLEGSVDQQYEEWRRLLREIYSTETGLPVSAEMSQTAEAADSGGS